MYGGTALGCVVLWGLAAVAGSAAYWLLGAWLIGVGINYVPVAAYSVALSPWQARGRAVPSQTSAPSNAITCAPRFFWLCLCWLRCSRRRSALATSAVELSHAPFVASWGQDRYFGASAPSPLQPRGRSSCSCSTGSKEKRRCPSSFLLTWPVVRECGRERRAGRHACPSRGLEPASLSAQRRAPTRDERRSAGRAESDRAPCSLTPGSKATRGPTRCAPQ